MGLDRNNAITEKTIANAYQEKFNPNRNDHSSLVLKTAYNVLTNQREKELYDSAFILDNPARWWPNSHAEFQEWQNKHPVSKKIEIIEY